MEIPGKSFALDTQSPQHSLEVGKLFLQHRVDQRIQLAAVYNLHEGLAAAFVADHVERGSVIDLDGFAQFLVGADQGGELAFGIDHKRQLYFVLRGKFLSKAAKVLRRNLKLVRKNVIAEFVAQCLGVRIEEPRKNGCVVRPGVERWRGVVRRDGSLEGG